MSLSTKLYLNSKWELDEIKTLVEQATKSKVIIEANLSTSTGYYSFRIPKIQRMINVFTNMPSPLGSCTLLMMGADDTSHKIFRDIADVIGGIFMSFDTDGKCEIISGTLSESDNLSYFLRYTAIHNGVKGMDIQGLIAAIEEWYDRCDPEHKPQLR